MGFGVGLEYASNSVWMVFTSKSPEEGLEPGDDIEYTGGRMTVSGLRAWSTLTLTLALTLALTLTLTPTPTYLIDAKTGFFGEINRLLRVARALRGVLPCQPR